MMRRLILPAATAAAFLTLAAPAAAQPFARAIEHAGPVVTDVQYRGEGGDSGYGPERIYDFTVRLDSDAVFERCHFGVGVDLHLVYDDDPDFEYR